MISVDQERLEQRVVDDLARTRASSTKPTTEASEVFLMICTMKPTVGGVAMRIACGRITLRHALGRG